jgi:hypothetical protein
MTETLSIKNNQSNKNDINTSYTEETDKKKLERKKSISSSNYESSFNNLNSEIKSIIENETDLSFSSNSNSDIDENKTNLEHLFDSKYWRASKDINSETDEPNSTYESQNEKGTPSKKENFFFFDKKNSPTPFHSKYAETQEMAGMSVGSNKQSTQSNEEEEARMYHLNNISYSESNNISPINSLGNNESDNENKKEKEKLKINIEEEKKYTENNKDKHNNINNNINNNKKLFINNGFFNYNNLQNIKYNNDTEYSYPYEPINYKNNSMPFFQGIYLPQQLCSFMPNYNYAALNKKNFIQNNNFNNKTEEVNNSEKKEEFHLQENNMNNGKNTQNQFTNNSYLNNINTYNKKIDMVDLPLVLNQNNPQTNPINYRYPKLNFNMLCCPQIQPISPPIQKPVTDKINNSTNYLPEINNKENNDKKVKNTTNNINSNSTNINNNSASNNNICPIIEQNNNNKIKINNKNFIINKSPNSSNNKGNLKGEKQFLNLDDIVTGKDTRTTVMIRNIPIKYTDEILIEALNEFNGKYDCLYMPYDYEKNGNKGYAFINFINPLHILYFYEKFNGQKWLHFESSKICELNCAHFQGINEIQKHAKNYKGQKKPSYYSRNENKENMIIPSKYLLKLKKRFPKMVYSENKVKKIIIVKSFE